MAFIIAPFLTNDGVCLLFVEPLLSVFDTTSTGKIVLDNSTNSAKSTLSTDVTVTDVESNVLNDSLYPKTIEKKHVLNSKDAVYFLLTLACSSNIGSALTYTGNPQVLFHYCILCVYM